MLSKNQYKQNDSFKNITIVETSTFGCANLVFAAILFLFIKNPISNGILALLPSHNQKILGFAGFGLIVLSGALALYLGSKVGSVKRRISADLEHQQLEIGWRCLFFSKSHSFRFSAINSIRAQVTTRRTTHTDSSGMSRRSTETVYTLSADVSGKQVSLGGPRGLVQLRECGVKLSHLLNVPYIDDTTSKSFTLQPVEVGKNLLDKIASQTNSEASCTPSKREPDFAPPAEETPEETIENLSFERLEIRKKRRISEIVLSKGDMVGCLPQCFSLWYLYHTSSDHLLRWNEGTFSWAEFFTSPPFLLLLGAFVVIPKFLNRFGNTLLIGDQSFTLRKKRLWGTKDTIFDFSTIDTINYKIYLELKTKDRKSTTLASVATIADNEKLRDFMRRKVQDYQKQTSDSPQALEALENAPDFKELVYSQSATGTLIIWPEAHFMLSSLQGNDYTLQSLEIKETGIEYTWTRKSGKEGLSFISFQDVSKIQAWNGQLLISSSEGEPIYVQAPWQNPGDAEELKAFLLKKIKEFAEKR